MLDSSKRRQLASTDLFKILHHDSFSIVAYHPDHLLNFLGGVGLIEAFEKKRNFFSSEASIVIYVDDIERLSKVFIRKKLAINIVAGGIGSV